MGINHNSRQREKKTVQIMIAMYCRHHHPESDRSAIKRCGRCEALYQYAEKRIDDCVFGLDKPVCSSCSTHCYKADMREHIRAVMRYSGPRMLYCHPVLAVYYFMDKCRSKKQNRRS